MFGVPFILQGGLDHDLDRYRETQTIVATLLRILDDREEALLLSIKDFPKQTQTTTHGLFVAGASSPKFIFMAKHAGGSDTHSKAIVFRISNDTDLLADAGPSLSVISIDDEAAIQYATFLDASLSSVTSHAFNPMGPLLQPTKSQSHVHDHLKIAEGTADNKTSNVEPVIVEDDTGAVHGHLNITEGTVATTTIQTSSQLL